MGLCISSSQYYLPFFPAVFVCGFCDNAPSFTEDGPGSISVGDGSSLGCILTLILRIKGFWTLAFLFWTFSFNVFAEEISGSDGTNMVLFKVIAFECKDLRKRVFRSIFEFTKYHVLFCGVRSLGVCACGDNVPFVLNKTGIMFSVSQNCGAQQYGRWSANAAVRLYKTYSDYGEIYYQQPFYKTHTTHLLNKNYPMLTLHNETFNTKSTKRQAGQTIGIWLLDCALKIVLLPYISYQRWISKNDFND